jgi:hypothetical protein
VNRYQRTLMPLAPQSPPESGERETKAIRCLPGGVANRGRSSMLKVWHGPTSTCLYPSEGQTSLLCRDRRGVLPGTCTERQIATENSAAVAVSLNAVITHRRRMSAG